MAIGDDFSISTAGDIRYVGTTATYTVIAFHRWLGDLQDDASSIGNDYLDITRATPSARATDNQITLNPPYNIDDHAARFIYNGSIIQDSGDTIYDGVQVLAPAGTPVDVIQNGSLVTPNFWTTGLNADAGQGISHRFMVKVRTGGADTDSRILIVQTREWGQLYSEFRINGTSRGNNVAALSAATDLNNDGTESTIEGYTTIVNTEGYQGLDVNNDSTDEYYYSQWDLAAYTINDLYERAKWLSAEPRTEDSNTDTGSDFAIGNGTINGQAQSFTVGANNVWIMRVFADLKKFGTPTGNITCSIYAHTGTYGTSSTPTGAAVATSVNVDVSKLTTSYDTIEFGFTTEVQLTASTYYCVAFEYTGGDASNYVQIDGLASSGTHSGNRSEDTGSWGATAADDLAFDAKTAGDLYEMPGCLFRGITHELDLTTPRSGSFQPVEPVTWTGGTGQMLAIDSAGTPTQMWIQLLTGSAPGSGVLITGTQSSATATTTGTATDRSLSFPFIGASTGSALIGGYGVGVNTNDLTSSDLLFDLTDTQRQPPNNVTFQLGGLVVGEDYALITPRAYFYAWDNGPSTWTDGETLTFSGGGTAKLLEITDDGTTGFHLVRMLTGTVPEDDETITGGSSGATADVNGTPAPDIDTEQLTLNGALSGGSVTSVVVNEAIPGDTPSTGTIRIRRADGSTSRHSYTAWATSTFTIIPHDFSSNNAASGAGVYVSYIDKLSTAATESFTGVYQTDRNLFIRVRDGGGSPIKSFETVGVLGSAGGSATAIRTTDT